MTKPGHELARLLSPRSIAVIGASRDRSSVSGQPVVNLREHGYAGPIYPVNPRHDEVDGLKCYPSILAVPDCPDLALIAINARLVPAVLRDCGERGVPFVLIISSGFAESGEEGADLQREVALIAQRYGIGVIGPNCQGMMNVAEGVFAGFGAAFKIPRICAGPVSLVTQSGGFGYSLVSMADEAGVGFRHVISTGNEVGISTLDLMRALIADTETRIIAGYVEGLRDARRLLEIGALALEARKPILMWKVGNSEPGHRAAISHTANLGGARELYKAAFRQSGMLEIGDVQDLVDTTHAVLHGREPQGRSVGIVTISGGAGVVMADVCAELGLAVPSLSPDSECRLREVLPAFGSTANPVDITGNVFNAPDVLSKVLRIVGQDENVDSLVIIPALVQDRLALRFASEIVEFNRSTEKPVLVCWSARAELAEEAYALLSANAIPRYPTPLRAGRALSQISELAEARRKRASRGRAASARSRSRLEAVHTLGTAHTLSEHAAKQLLARYGIPVTRERISRSKAEAVSLSAKIGFPVVLKVDSPDIPHKTDCGGVRVGLTSRKDVAHAYDDILRNARMFNPGARIDGVLVQEMIRGVEAIVGVTNDERFGPAIMFGLGGVFAEILKDFAFRICPIDAQDAMEMIRQVKGFPILAGARGGERADIQALVDTLLKVSAFAMDLRDSMGELDINPLFVLAEGQGVIAADALIQPLSPSADAMSERPTAGSSEPSVPAASGARARWS